MAIAGIPLVLALIAGRFVRGFKGLGVELEMQLSSPVISNSTVIDITSQVSSATKQELQAVFALPQEKKNSTNVLTFKPRAIGYYIPGDVREYLGALPNVQFFEVVDQALRLKFLIDIRDLRQRMLNWEDSTTNNLIKIIEGTAQAETDLRNNIIYERIQTTNTLPQAFEKIKQANKDFLPVVDQAGKLFGLLYKNRVTEAIANEVVKAFHENPLI